MKRNCKFQMNPAFALGMTLLWSGVFVQNVLEIVTHWTHFLCGAGVGLSFVGLLCGSPKTRLLFDRFCALKARLLGR